MGGGSVRPNIKIAFPGDAVMGGDGEPMVTCPDEGSVEAGEIGHSENEEGVLTAHLDQIRLIGADGKWIATSTQVEGLANCIRRGYKYRGRLEVTGKAALISFWQEMKP